jgi:hypothetical protein
VVYISALLCEYQENIPTSRNSPTFTTPLSVSFSSGITGRQRKESVMKGSDSLHPSPTAAAMQLSMPSATTSRLASESSPATGRGRRARTRPSARATSPPPISLTARTAASISASVTPTTAMLCESWATDVARAPQRRPKPCTSPRPMLPVPLCLSTTAILRMSSSVSEITNPSLILGGKERDLVTICWSTTPMTLAGPSSARMLKEPGPMGAIFILRRSAPPAGFRGTQSLPSSATTLPSLITFVTRSPSRSSRTTMSAR